MTVSSPFHRERLRASVYASGYDKMRASTATAAPMSRVSTRMDR